MAFNKAWVVDHGPVRLHRSDPEDIIPPTPPSRMRRKVDQFRTLASRAANRIGMRIGDLKVVTKPRKKEVPARTFTTYGERDIFINPFGSNITPERNISSRGPEETVYDTYERVPEPKVTPYDVAMDVMGVRRLSLEAAYREEYQPDPLTAFEASNITSSYQALHYLASTSRSALFTAMWRHMRNNNNNGGQGDVLHRACAEGHDRLVRVLLQRDAVDVDQVDSQGATALFYAVDRDHTECARLLIAKGAVAEVDERLEPGGSVLSTAAKRGNLEVARALLELDAWVDVNGVGDYDYTALHLAADGGHDEVIKYLLSRGADLEAITKSDRTAFEIAMHNNKLDTARLLHERGANIMRIDGHGRSILHWAAGAADPHIVDFLLDQGADASLANALGTMPHHVAARHGRAANLHALLSRGARLNASWSPETGSKQRSPPTTGKSKQHVALADALEARKYACVVVLLMHGAIPTTSGVPAESREQIAELLLRAANDLAHDPPTFGGHIIEAFLYSGHIRRMRPAILEMYKKMSLYGDMEAWYRQLVPRVPTLKNLCRVHLRRRIIGSARGGSIWCQVLELPLPDALLDFLLMKECDLDRVVQSYEEKLRSRLANHAKKEIN